MKKTILCFGDSNTHGYCSETGGRFDDTKRYPCLLEKYLGDGYIVREEGLSGRTTVFEDPLFGRAVRSVRHLRLPDEPRTRGLIDHYAWNQ